MNHRLKKTFKYGGIGLVALILGLVLSVAFVLRGVEFGGAQEGTRFERNTASSQHNGEHFVNRPPPPDRDLMELIREMRGDEVRQPPGPLPVIKPELEEQPSAGLRAYWFGHATVLIEIDGYRVMTDPILSDYAFPVKALAPKRFNPPPLALDELPKIDAVVISHDHFDHLDMKTIKALSERGTQFFFGLGIGAHFERWEVPAEQLHELDWWESGSVGDLRIHSTPAQHYSGRTLKTNPTLWSSWVIEGDRHRVFHSGDTGYGRHFREIGEKRGPIDLALIKVGDYGNDKAWAFIHMHPEYSIKAHVDLGAKTLLPIHWGTFQLSFHDWDAPIERTVEAATTAGIHLVTPMLGERFEFGQPYENKAWWRSVVNEQTD